MRRGFFLNIFITGSQLSRAASLDPSSPEIIVTPSALGTRFDATHRMRCHRQCNCNMICLCIRTRWPTWASAAGYQCAIVQGHDPDCWSLSVLARCTTQTERFEYGKHLSRLAPVCSSDRLLIVAGVWKNPTTLGWKGLVYDPIWMARMT